MSETTLSLALRLVTEKVLQLLEDLECDHDDWLEIDLELHGILAYIEDDGGC